MNEEKEWSRYGLTELAWREMTTEQREIHYRRVNVCEHPYEYKGIETAPGIFDKREDGLRDEYSFDPYFHTAHMIPHTPKDQACECQTCALKIGIERRLRP